MMSSAHSSSSWTCSSLSEASEGDGASSSDGGERTEKRKAPRSVRTESKRKDIVVAQTLYGPRDQELESAKEELQRLRMKLGLDRMTFTSHGRVLRHRKEKEVEEEKKKRKKNNKKKHLHGLEAQGKRRGVGKSKKIRYRGRGRTRTRSRGSSRSSRGSSRSSSHTSGSEDSSESGRKSTRRARRKSRRKDKYGRSRHYQREPSIGNVHLFAEESVIRNDRDPA